MEVLGRKMKNNGPDFICIGAQKAGTSWLWKMLKSHPEIWVTPKKDIHYFDRALSYPSPSYLLERPIYERLIGREDWNHHYRVMLRHDFQNVVLRKNLRDFIWLLKYYFGDFEDDWYISLFKGGGKKLKGEITPSYSILDVKDVRRVFRLFPRVQIIFIMRNPIDRAWSQLRFHWTKSAIKSIDDHNELINFIESPEQQLRSNYVRTIKIWQSVFPADQLLLCFYDDLVSNQTKYLSNIFNYLKVQDIAHELSEIDGKRINISQKIDIPVEIYQYLANKYSPEIDKLCEMLSRVPEEWRVGH
ncbi:MAG TPA: sulfotransferase [Bacteroidetes bacterium]|nr:sulfotransferase [Bacteroidota bacterium]